MRPLVIGLAFFAGAFVVLYVVVVIVFSNAYPPVPQREKIASTSSKTPEEYLSPHLRILMFYPANPAAPLGRPQTVCYGVLNAVSATLDPPLEELKPVLNHCFSVTVRSPRMLTLTATGKNGEQAVAAFKLGARRPRATFTFLQLSTLTPRRGERVTLCYGTNSAESVRLLPEGPPLRPSARHCIEFTANSEAYRLVAESKNGQDLVPLPFKFKD
jgi:hypothetical protein